MIPLFDPTPYDLRSPSLLARAERLQALSLYYQTPHWRRFRWYVILFYGYRCQRCGRVRIAHRLNVHHRHYRTLWHEGLSDVELLCVDCHDQHHRGAGRRPRDNRP
jgi:5-methylcytosine-specific restriction endonuclease McrA